MSKKSMKADYALVPGSFKPPHKGHYEMVKFYASKAKNVIVFISNPKTKLRVNIDGRAIDSQTAKKIFEIYTRRTIPNCRIIISTFSSPIQEIFELLLRDPRFLNKTIILGSSLKNKDYERWDGVKPFIQKNDLDITIIDPKTTAFEPERFYWKGQEVTINATQMRQAQTIEDLKPFLPEHLTETEIQEVARLLQIID